MKRLLFGLVLMFSLGCSGITEVLLESATGGQVEMGADGSFEMTMPDGMRVKTVPNGELPEDFPMPEPWDGAETQSLVLTTDSEGVTSVIATYTLERPREEVVDRYTAWGQAQDLGAPRHDKQSNAGTASESWVWNSEDGPLVFSINDAFGQSSVTIGRTPPSNLKAPLTEPDPN